MEAHWSLRGTKREDRRRTWDLLKRLKREMNLPWCVIGDMNNVMRQEDKKGGRPYPTWLLDGFNQTILECQLYEMKLEGYPFTWETGRRVGRLVEIRLDRAFACASWMALFEAARLINIEISTSDHYPILLEPLQQVKMASKRKFRFENAWTLDPMCRQVVKECWEGGEDQKLTQKIEMCGAKLEEWGKHLTGNFRRRINECKSKIKRLRWRTDPTSKLELCERQKEMLTIMDQQERYWKQRSKQFWLKAGDQNTKYFHRSASGRKKANQINRLQNNSGEWVDWSFGLDKVIIGYFKELFKSNENSVWDEVTRHIPSTVTREQNESLLAPVEAEEVRRAVFSMHLDKAPGPDGMTPGFYQKHWHIVAKDIVNLVAEVFASGALPEGLCDTNVVLIPKKKSPAAMGDLRPISLCNVVYKIISKVIANRMQCLMQHVVSDTQSAFVPGRLISDNILISFEVMHYLKRKRRGNNGFMAVKLDMSKAYDRVEWGFIRAMLLQMGFHEKWVEILMACVCSGQYTVTHGSVEMEPIRPTRGLRQEDSLSPYLFIVCAEGLSAIIKSHEGRGRLHGVRVARGAPAISHMLFADDSYLFCKATGNEASNLKEMLSTFELASGQKVNYDKSSIFFSPNNSTRRREELCSLLGMEEANDRRKYLGLPNCLGRNKSETLGYLKERVRVRLQSWDGRILSRAGKEILIKTVVQALPSYAMSVFLLPNEICKDIEQMMAKFLWRKSANSENGIHWMSWERMSRHKAMGGMGFRDLRDFNLALLGKQGWRMIMAPESLVSRIFRAKYFSSTSFLEAELGSNPSYVWRSIWEAKKILLEGVRWRIGDGADVDILRAPWLPDENNPFVYSQHPGLVGMKVKSLMVDDKREWDVDLIHDMFEERDRDLILSIPLPLTEDRDGVYWSEENTGSYSVKSAYKMIQRRKGRWEGEMAATSWRRVWKLKVPPKIKDFIWRACNSCLPTADQLRTKRVEVHDKCVLCEEEEETTIHVLARCNFASQCLSRVSETLSRVQEESFREWFRAVGEQADGDKLDYIAAVCWSIWKARNERVWRNKVADVGRVVVAAMEFLDQWKSVQHTDDYTTLPLTITGDGARKWRKPQDNQIKVNVDAAVFDEDNCYGTGMVARDWRGDLLEARTFRHTGRVRAELAEAVGIREAMSWIKEKGWGNVVVESDSLLCISAIRNQCAMASPFGLIIKDCRDLLCTLKEVSLFFIYRSANEVAHSLARASRSFPERFVSEGNVPAVLLPRILDEAR